MKTYSDDDLPVFTHHSAQFYLFIYLFVLMQPLVLIHIGDEILQKSVMMFGLLLK